MKSARRARGAWVISKITIQGFSQVVQPTLHQGLLGWRDLREELRKSAPTILEIALAASENPQKRPQEDNPQQGEPTPSDRADEFDDRPLQMRWADPVFPSLVSPSPPPPSGASMPPFPGP
jgi:hypothetical protein